MLRCGNSYTNCGSNSGQKSVEGTWVIKRLGLYRNFIRVGCGNPWSAKIEMALLRLGQLAGELA